jgi:hypothetical protein
VERNHLRRGAYGESGGDPPDLTNAGKEREDVAAGVGDLGGEQIGEGVLPAVAAGERSIRGLDGEDASRAVDDRGGACGIVEGDERGHPIGVERGGHEQHGEVGSGAAGLEQQRQCEIRVDRAFVELVEDHQPRVFEQRVDLERPREQRLGHHLEPGLRSNPRRRTDPVARAPAEGLPEQLADACGHGCRGKASGLQHADFTSTQPRPVEEPGGYQGGFARPRLGGQDAEATPLEGFVDAGQERDQGESGGGGIHGAARGRKAVEWVAARGWSPAGGGLAWGAGWTQPQPVW